MGTDQQTPQERLQSLIPAIREEEDRLQRMLDEARQQAGQMVEQAEKEAAQQVREAKQTLPEWIAAERDRRLEDTHTRAEQLRTSRPQRIADLRKAAAYNMDAAVARIVDAITGTKQ
jgi:vacuolar-type H+-ATPase subunit H